MDPKTRPNHRIYLQVLRGTTPEQRLEKALELSALTRSLFAHGLRKRFPDLSDEQFKALLIERLHKCHSRSC
jgi:hypothetical protein